MDVMNFWPSFMNSSPGFRFCPNDKELVTHYLKNKIAGTIEFNIIAEIDLYKQEPWDLPVKSFLSGSDMEWYFFTSHDKKYPNRIRTNRATEAGYWKATGKDKHVKEMGQSVGMKKTLVFYMGRAPHGERTDWVMHEYRLYEECEKMHASQELFVLCRVLQKSGVGPRSGNDRGPRNYVDDDFDKESSGSLVEALELETIPTLTIEPTSAPNLSVDDYAPSKEASQGGKDVDTPNGMMWSCDLGSTVQQQQQLQQDESNKGVGYLDVVQLELLESDDILPALVEEPELNGPPNEWEASGVASNSGQKENQHLRGRWLTKARSRVAFLQSTTKKAQKCARNNNDGLYYFEGTPQQWVLGLEAPSQAKERYRSLDVTWPTPQVSVTNNFDTNQQPSSSKSTSSTSTARLGISEVSSSEDGLLSFQDNFFDFGVDDELIDNGLSIFAPHEFVRDQESSDVKILPQPDKSKKHRKSASPEGSSSSSSPQGVPSGKTRPLSNPLAGLFPLDSVGLRHLLPIAHLT